MKKLLVAFCLLIPFAAYCQNFDSVIIKTTKITDAVYMLEGAGGNIGVLIGNDGIILIDDQFGPLSEKIKNALKAISDKPVKFVINTHYHGDHSGGNANFGNDGAIIVSHDNTRKRLSADQFMAAFNQEQKATPYEGLPKITFHESLTLHLNGETIQVFHVKNAHTDGDAIIYFKVANVIHGGDVFVRYGLPFIDQGNGGSIDGMIAGAEKILTTANENTVIIPGHGQLAKKKDVLAFKDMLQTVRARVMDGIKKKKPLDAIIATDPGRGYVAVFDKAAFVNTVYYSLKK
jgi:glyoxylase-like metal-dependent hydrolase (beta-lactamase superfamily II)